jgi:hypothetical protein
MLLLLLLLTAAKSRAWQCNELVICCCWFVECACCICCSGYAGIKGRQAWVHPPEEPKGQNPPGSGTCHRVKAPSTAAVGYIAESIRAELAANVRLLLQAQVSHGPCSSCCCCGARVCRHCSVSRPLRVAWSTVQASENQKRLQSQGPFMLGLSELG